jgi:hypothetical protein
MTIRYENPTDYHALRNVLWILERLEHERALKGEADGRPAEGAGILRARLPAEVIDGTGPRRVVPPEVMLRTLSRVCADWIGSAGRWATLAGLYIQAATDPTDAHIKAALDAEYELTGLCEAGGLLADAVQYDDERDDEG